MKLKAAGFWDRKETMKHILKKIKQKPKKLM